MRLNAGIRNDLRKQNFGHLTIGADSLDLRELEKVMPKEVIGVIKRSEERHKDGLAQLTEVPMEFLPIVLTNDSSKIPEMVSIYNGVMDRRNPYSIPNMGSNILNTEAIAKDDMEKDIAVRYQARYNREGAEREHYREDDKPIYVNGDENGDPRDDFVQDQLDAREAAEAYAYALIAEAEAQRLAEEEQAKKEAAQKEAEDRDEDYPSLSL